MESPALQALDTDLWVASRPLRLWVGDVGCRMTAIRLLDGEVWLHSPVPLDAETRAAVDAIGPVRWLVGPNKFHHFYLGDWARAYPAAAVCGAPGLPAKRRDLHFNHELTPGAPPPWGDDISLRCFRGAPLLNEVVFHHPRSRTLIFTDLSFNVPARRDAPLFLRLVGVVGRFGPSRLVRLGIRDRKAARASLERILDWEFERVIVSHGEVLEHDGRAAVEKAFARFLRA
jgi:hypothetical protein